MKNFDFSTVSDLDLTVQELYAVSCIYEKQKVNQDFWHETPQMFVENFVRCLKVAAACNVVPSVMAAQGIDESGWFSTDSLFGVKATKLQTSQGIGTAAPTKEVVNGITIPTVGTFFETSSVQNCFSNYFNYISRMKPQSNQYIPFDKVGYLTYLQALPAYSTAGSAYIVSILNVIHSNSLDAFDHL